MHFAVTVLYREGVKLSREEIAAAPAHCGNLLLKPLEPARSRGKAMLTAELFMDARAGTPYSLIGCMFEPALIKMTERWFVLGGWEINTRDGVLVHNRQEWLIRPSTAELEAKHRAYVTEKAERVHRLGPAAWLSESACDVAPSTLHRF